MPFLMAAPTGARRGKSDHPGIPISIEESVETALACWNAGADAFHLHVRDENGGHSIDTGLYQEALGELARAVPDMPIQVTTESGGIYDVPSQYALLNSLKPKWASLSVREAARDSALAPKIYQTCDEQGTELQHILFDEKDAAQLGAWIDQGIVLPRPSVILVLGRYTTDMNSNPNDLEPFLQSLPDVGKWMLCAFGPNEHACLETAAKLGGDVRVGFENSYVQQDGTPWPDMPSSIKALRARI